MRGEMDFTVLEETLRLAVPMHVEEVRDWPATARAAAGRELGQVVAEKGDALMFGGRKGEAARVFNALARGLALVSCQPGGVTFRGLHWCAWPHPRCPRRAGRRAPECCACPEGCDSGEAACPAGCGWCRNGCAGASGRGCCRDGGDWEPWRPAVPAHRGTEDVPDPAGLLSAPRGHGSGRDCG